MLMAIAPARLEELTFLEAETPELGILSWASAAIALRIRGFTRDGIFDRTHTTNSDRSMAEEYWRIPSYPLWLAVTRTSGTPRRGQCYIKLVLRLAGVVAGNLFSGYLDMHQAVLWPPGKIESSVEGPGLLRSITGTDPAAGVEISETVPTNARWRLRSVIASLVTNATVANRVVQWIIDDGTTVFFGAGDGVNHAASLTRNHSLEPIPTRGDVTYTFNTPFPDSGLELFQGWRIRTSTQNFQAGDNWGAPQLLVEEWIEE